MRTLLKASMNTEATNQATKDGSIKRVFETFAEQYKPEAAYFTAENGKRTAYFFFDLKDSTQIPGIAEPFFQQLGAELTLAPVMNSEEVMKGLELWSRKR